MIDNTNTYHIKGLTDIIRYFQGNKVVDEDGKKMKTTQLSVRNFMEPDDFSAILLRPSPLDFQVGNNVDTSDDLTEIDTIQLNTSS